MFDLPSQVWISITALGSSGLTLAFAFMIAVWLAYDDAWRRATAWLLGLGMAIAVVAVTKIAFLGWGIGVRAWDFTGFSGHAMLSTAVYPTVFFLMMARKNAAIRLLGIAVGLMVGVGVAISRLVLNAHSPSEVISGWLIGMTVALLFIACSWDAQPRRWFAATMGVSFACILVALHGNAMPAHYWITQVALQLSGHERPYLRDCWKVELNCQPVSCPPALHASVSESVD